MQLIGHIVASTESELLALRHGMEYLMHRQHEPIMHSRENIFKINKIPLQCFFKSVNA